MKKTTPPSKFKARWLKNQTLFLIVFALLLPFGEVNAQMVSIGGTCTNTVASNSYGNMNSTTNSSATGRGAIIYNASQLTGIAASTLTNIYFLKANGTNLTGTPNFKVYLKETTSVDFGSGALDWATAIVGATLVYDGNPATDIAGVAGMKGLPLIGNFFYGGTNNLMVLTEYVNTGNTTSVTWYYEYNTPCVNTSNSNTTKYITNTTGTLGASLSSSDYRRPVIGFDYSLTPCSGTASAGTASASTTNACSNTPFSLSLTGATTGGGVTYQWQSSPQGTNTFTDIAGATKMSHTVIAQTTPTDYRCIVTCTNSNSTDTSNIVIIGQNPASQCYCVPTGGTTYYLKDVVTTGGLTNFTYAATSHSIYQDRYTNNILSFSQSPGSSLNVLMTPSASTNYFYCWVDWNQDGDFDDAGETIWATTSYTANYNGTITIPTGLAQGDYRVRFAQSFSGSITSCGPAPNGTYVDVKLVIPQACTGTPVAGTALTSTTNACANSPFDLTLNGSTVASGLTFQWQSSPQGAGTWTDITGATSTSYTVTNQTAATDYRCVISCSTSNNTDTSNIVSVAQNAPNQCYCIPTGGTTYYLKDVVTTGGFTNFTYTATSHSIYQDRYTNTPLSFSQMASGSVNVLMTPSASTNYFYCWVDWNQDGDFDDAGETIWATTSYTSNYNGTITVPAGQALGSYRVRFAQSFSGSITSCGPAPNGSYVDVELEVTIAPPPILTTTQKDNLCFDGTNGMASVTVTYGQLPLVYSWFPSGGNSHTATDLAAGTYTVTVTDALNRSETATVTITEPNNITSGLVYTDISCKGNNNGSATVNPTGGTGPYKILWSTNAITSTISGLLVGQYSVTITDANGCILTEDFSISEPNTLIASIGQQTDVSRYLGNDGSATVNITGGTAPYNYLWAPTGDTTDTASNLVAGTYSVLVTDANGCTANQTFVISQPIPLTINLVSKKDVTCKGLNNGEITVSLMGNHPPFTLNWAPIGGTSYTAANLTAGEYTLLVSNSIGETTTATFTITEPDALDVILGNTIDVTCFGGYNGSATANVIGGVAPYSFVWSNGESSATASNLTAGNHFVHITDANGCVIRKTFTIGQPSAIVISETINNISCNGQANGSVSITASGGTAPYTYSWNTGETSPSINNLSAGKYTLTITDAKNCFVSKTFNVVEPAFVYPPIAANQSFCVNAKLSDIIITGSNIKWYDDATNGNILPIGTNLVSGNVYYASQTINSCESSTRTAVQVTLFQPIPLTTVKIDVCNNTTIQDIVIDGNGFSQLRWYSNATSTTMLHYNHLLASGTYYVSTFTNNVCESIKYPIQVNVVAAVPAPIVGTQMVCGVKTFNDISINNVPGGIINWYSSVQSVTPLTGTDQILSGTYYIEQVVGSCKSGRVAVPVQVIPITSPNLTNITVCDGTTISELNNNLTSIKYIWYNDATTQTALNETQIIKAGTFYIAQEISGCISNRTKVDVVVNSRPNAPTGQQIQSFNFAATIFNLKMNQTGVEWYNSIQNANTLSNQLPSSTQLKDGETYYGIIRGVNGCPSYPTAVKVVVNLGFNELDLAYLKYYPNPIETELNIEYNEVIKGIEVYSITGQKVLNKEFNDKQIKVNLSGFSSGTYMVRIETEKASQFIKIVKR